MTVRLGISSHSLRHERAGIARSQSFRMIEPGARHAHPRDRHHGSTLTGARFAGQVRRITAPLDRSRMTFLESRTTMEFAALFLAVTIVMLAAWWGTRALALALFAVTLMACVATYLHHASDVLKLSF
jgi:Family of unknown function (DUF5993)